MENVFRLPRLYSAIQIIGIKYTLVEAKWSYPSHRHPYFDFLYCVQGEMQQWANGRPYTLKAGEAMIVKPGVYHHTAPQSESAEYFNFHFDIEMREIHTIFQMDAEPVLMYALEDHESIQKWVEDFIIDFGQDLKEMDPANVSANLFNHLQASVRILQMNARIMELVGHLANRVLAAHRSNVIEDTKISPAQIMIAREVAYLLETQATEGVQIQELADRLNLNRSYITFCFKQVYGLSPRAYLTNLRIREAKRALQETEESVEQIAERLSFSSSGHLIRAFRTAMGITPQQFRKHSL
ncbi:helix-turn-helix domain-containing protein [Paenibacillus psychroresistens]|nr:AraC family transcriptional regulator [Paenibacillus psychroresistens]